MHSALRRWTSIFTLASIALGDVAVAQTATIEEVIVTARKREESLMEVPLTVTAHSAQAIEQRGVKSLEDLAQFTPSFTITNAGGTSGGRWQQGLTIRGIPAASVFIDGASAGRGIVQDIDDVERVEVLKGPQSSYFGRSTFAGAVNVVTKTPSNEFGGKVSALLGSDDWYDVRASVEGPIFTEKLTGRISVRMQEMDGPYKNYGAAPARLGGQSTKSISGALYSEPFEGLRIKLYGHYSDNSDGPAPLAKFARSDYNCNASQTNPAGPNNFICGTLPDVNERRLAADGVIDELYIRTVLNNSRGVLNPVFNRNYPYIDHAGLEQRIYHANLRVDYDIPAIGATFTSLTATNANDRNLLQDQDLQATTTRPNPAFPANPNVQPFVNWLIQLQGRDDDTSQEFRLVSDQDQRFRWLLGASYVWKVVQQSVGGMTPFAGATLINNGEPNKTATTGGFFGLSYDILPQLSLDLEGRYQIDKVMLYNRTLADVQTLAVENEFKNFVPRVNLSYRPWDDGSIYATYSEGVNPGSFNSRFLTAAPIQIAALQQFSGASLIVQPEELKNYEVGIKQTLLDGRATIAASAYYAKWTNQITQQQASVPNVDAAGNPSGGFALIIIRTNIGETEVQGLEFEGTLLATDSLSINLAGAINESEIKENLCLTCATITGNPDVSGNELPRYPKWNGSLGVQYKDDLTADMRWYTRGDLIYQAGVWEEVSNLVKTDETKRVNLRLGLETDRYTLEAFVLNAFDDRTLTSPELNSDALSPGLSDRAVNALMPLPRQYGVRYTYNF